HYHPDPVPHSKDLSCWKLDKLAPKPEEYTRVRSSIILAIDSFCHPILDVCNILSIA
ncbi:hypothetical protein K503DRAFT_870549, partial [Rhizopogon vinicolor AM-OR11-026]